MILDAVEQAFQEAGLHQDSLDRSRVGVVVGTRCGGEFANQLLLGLRLPEFQKRLDRRLAQQGCADEKRGDVMQQFADVLVQEFPALLDETGSFTSSSLASRITKSFDLMGGGVAVDAGECSSSAALACCADQLVSGDCDMMICVGGHADLSPTRLESMGLAGVLAEGSPKSPFDVDAQGSVPGEGCCAVLLMRLADAKQQQRKVFAVIRGVGVAAADERSEAPPFTMSMTGPPITFSSNEVQKCMPRAIVGTRAKPRPSATPKSSMPFPLWTPRVVERMPCAKSKRRPRDAREQAASEVHSQTLPDRLPARPSAGISNTPRPIKSTTSREGLSHPELKRFLTDFVVEQTGYPPEFVGMDADLEADLGIDSIKKAQMFAELGEQISVTPDENLTLNDFPTLQHVFDYLVATAESPMLSNRSKLAETSIPSRVPGASWVHCVRRAASRADCLSGHARSLDEGSDGMVPGEGVAVLSWRHRPRRSSVRPVPAPAERRKRNVYRTPRLRSS